MNLQDTEFPECPNCGWHPTTWWDIDDGKLSEGFNVKCCIIQFCRTTKEIALEDWKRYIQQK